MARQAPRGAVKRANTPRQEKPLRREQGASQSKTSYRDLFRAYLANHRRVALESLQRVLTNPLASLMTWMVIGIALALPAGLYVALGNIEKLSRSWDGAAQISLFLLHATTEEEALALRQRLILRDDVARVDYISPDEALEEFERLSGFGAVLDNLDGNPLPAVLVVRPKASHTSAGQARKLVEELQQMAMVEFAQLDLEWVQRLHSMMKLGRQLAFALALLLALGVFLVIGNTIRLSIENRRDEIVVTKLVGATDAFVRRPFLYAGLWYGLGGGLVAWLIISVALYWLSGPVGELIDLYQSNYQLLGLSGSDVLGIWFTGGLLGLLGSWLAVGQHLSDIQPR